MINLNTIIKYYLILKGRATKYLRRDWKGNRWVYTYKPVSQRGAHELTKNRFEKHTKITDSTHKDSVEKALQEGRYVNTRILRDYPDLIKKYNQEKRIQKADRINAKVKEIMANKNADNDSKNIDMNEVNVDNKANTEINTPNIDIKINPVEDKVVDYSERPTGDFKTLISNQIFRDIFNDELKNYSKINFPNVIDENFKIIDNDAWSRIVNSFLTGLREENEKYDYFAKLIYDKYKPGSWEEISKIKKEKDNIIQQEKKSITEKYHNKKLGNVEIEIDGYEAFLKFPFDLSFSNKLKNNYNATWNPESKKWSIHVSHLDKLEKLILKYEKDKEIINKKIEAEKKQRQIEKDEKYLQQKKLWEAEKEEKRKKLEEQAKVETKKEKIYLNVPYSEKDYAKGYGAKWDSYLKKWYIESDNNYKEKFKKYMPLEKTTTGKTFKREIPYKSFSRFEEGQIILHEGDYVKIKSVKVTHHPENDYSNPYDFSREIIEYEPIISEEDKKKVEELKLKAEKNKNIKMYIKILKDIPREEYEFGMGSYGTTEKDAILNIGNSSEKNYYAIRGDKLVHIHENYYDGMDYDTRVGHFIYDINNPKIKEFIDFCKTL